MSDEIIISDQELWLCVYVQVFYELDLPKNI